jgi:hypothetical protein
MSCPRTVSADAPAPAQAVRRTCARFERSNTSHPSRPVSSRHGYQSGYRVRKLISLPDVSAVSSDGLTVPRDASALSSPNATAGIAAVARWPRALA